MGWRRSRASSRLPWRCQRRASRIAARSSHILADWARDIDPVSIPDLGIFPPAGECEGSGEALARLFGMAGSPQSDTPVAMAAHTRIVTTVLRRKPGVLGRVVVGQSAFDVLELG